ncbi:MAG TPA: hypothetical protein VE861_08105 [Gemmatimonadaceae bacterium]|nr:hypothetical protein [Gemmatimonadaceae bacterium]
MIDLTRDEVQDRLPDLLHGRLSAAEVAVVERAIAADPGLAAEFALLRSVKASHAPVATFDISRISSALPTPPVRAASVRAQTLQVDELAMRRAARQQPMISRRFARAAALLVVVGGGTMVSVWSGRGPAVAPRIAPVATESIATAANTMQLGLGTSTDDLSVEALRALEADIRALDGMPSADPDFGADILAEEGA